MKFFNEMSEINDTENSTKQHSIIKIYYMFDSI